MNKEPRVCLAMLAKDRPEIVERSIRSVAPLVSAALVSVEPGDSLGRDVSELLTRLDVPHSVVEFSRVDPRWGSVRGDFARTLLFCRGEEYAAARGCGWLLNVDADDELQHAPDFVWPADLDDRSDQSHIIVERFGDQVYLFPRLFRVGLGWRWRYPVHELPECDAAPIGSERSAIPGVVYLRHEDGDRVPGLASSRAEAIERWLAEPGNEHDTRMLFYLGRAWLGASLREGLVSAAHLDRAISALERRVALEGPADERWHAALTLAGAKATRGDDPSEIADAWFRAAELNGARAESFMAPADWFAARKELELALAFSSFAFDLPQAPGAAFLVSTADSTWRPAAMTAKLALRLGEFRLAERAARAALAMTPPAEFQHVLETILTRAVSALCVAAPRGRVREPVTKLKALADRCRSSEYSVAARVFDARARALSAGDFQCQTS